MTEFNQDEIPTNPQREAMFPPAINHDQDIDLGPVRHADGNVGPVGYGLGSGFEFHNPTNDLDIDRAIIREYCEISMRALEHLHKRKAFKKIDMDPLYDAIYLALTQIAKLNLGPQITK